MVKPGKLRMPAGRVAMRNHCWRRSQFFHDAPAHGGQGMLISERHAAIVCEKGIRGNGKMRLEFFWGVGYSEEGLTQRRRGAEVLADGHWEKE
jgi:hypothetical protein